MGSAIPSPLLAIAWHVAARVSITLHTRTYIDAHTRFAAETQELASNIVTKDGAQSTALQSTRAELVMESEGARALMEAVAQRS